MNRSRRCGSARPGFDQTQIVDLGRRLNSALAQRVQELVALPLGILRTAAPDPVASAPTSGWWATVSCSSRRCCSPRARRRSIRPARPELDKLAAAMKSSRRRSRQDHRLGAAGRRPHRYRSDPVLGFQVELGTVGGARHRRRQVADRARGLAQPSGRGGVRRVPADREGESEEIKTRNRRIELKLTER